MKQFILFSVIILSLSAITSCDPESILDESDISGGYKYESADDYAWSDSLQETITLNGTSATTTSSKVTISGSTVTITDGGYYILSGTLTNGQIVINSDSGIVRIKLNSVTLSNSTTSPFYIKSSKKTVIFLENGTSNIINDANTYNSTEEPNAAIFSNGFLSITGDGGLTVKGNCYDGIASDDELIINSGTISVTAKDDALRGKDFLKINGGTLTATSTSGHALKSDDTETKGYGYILINGGTLNLTSSAADGLHATKRVIVNDGKLTINATASQGLNADSIVNINGGTITVNSSREGIESYNITVTGGTTILNATNDAINATAGTVSGGTESNDKSSLNVTGGILIANCSNGDGIDSNGNVYISGGTTIANGPQSGVEEGADVNGSFIMTKGIFISAGSNSNMTKSMSTTSTQPNLYIKSGSAISSSTLLHIEDASGTEIMTYKPKNGGYYFLFSSEALTKGSSYKIYTGGSYTGGSFTGGTSGYGLYTGGTYSTTGGTLKKTATLSSSSTVNTITF